MNSSAFTLIEIMVSISVIFLLVGLGFAGYVSFNQRQILITSGQNLKNMIRDAQSRAYNNEIDCTPGVCNCLVNSSSDPTGWYVDFTSQSIYGQCGVKTFSEKPFLLASEITIVPVPTSYAKILYRNTPPGVDKVVDICLSKANLDNSYYKISVNSAGVVSDSGNIIPSCP